MKAIIVAALLLSLPSQAYSYNAMNLMQDCQSMVAINNGSRSADALGAGGCIGYVIGLIDANETVSAAHPNAALFCLPRNANAEQAMLVILKHLTENPSRLHLSPGQLAIPALRTAFPCRQLPNK